MDATDAGVYAREIPFLERYVQIGAASGRVLSVSFPESPDDDAGEEHPVLDRIEGYAAGERESFADVDVALTMPTDRRAVLESVRGVPYGERTTVAALARVTAGLDPEDGEDVASIRTALAENPAPLLVPDHRVSDGPSAAPPSVEQRLRSIEGL